jgi:hypothetical protein
MGMLNHWCSASTAARGRRRARGHRELIVFCRAEAADIACDLHVIGWVGEHGRDVASGVRQVPSTCSMMPSDAPDCMVCPGGRRRRSGSPILR